jgi:mannose-6-phosphate isomerase-like protein (cupin superfamily)
MKQVTEKLDFEQLMMASIARYADRNFDWNAFPGNERYAGLERAIANYVGRNPSLKKEDLHTLKPEHFTIGLVYKPRGQFVPLHQHALEESYFIFDGISTVGCERDGELVEVRLGPKDMISIPINVPHGLRNDGVDPLQFSVVAEHGREAETRFLAHPRDNTEPALAARLGVLPEKIMAFNPFDPHPLQQLMAQNVVRYTDQVASWDPAGFARKIYVGEGGVVPCSNRKELIFVPCGQGVKSYARDVEDVYFVTEGVVTVGWEKNGLAHEIRLGRKDVMFNPAGRPHYFRNEGTERCEFFMFVGSKAPEAVKFRAR